MSDELNKYSMTVFMGTPSMVLDTINGNWVNITDHEAAIRKLESTITHLNCEIKELMKEIDGW